MATFPALVPSEAPITPGSWPVTPHSSLNGSETRVRHGSAQIGARWRPQFLNVTQASFLAILAHYREQRSGFDAFGFDPVTLAADRTPAGHAWIYTSRPEVVDHHADLFTVECEFRCEPRGLVVVPGRRWRTGATVFTPGARSSGVGSNPGANWVTPATTFTPGGGFGELVYVAGVNWATPATTFTPGPRTGGVGSNAGVNWVTSSTTFTPGSRVGSSGASAYTFTGGTTMAWASDIFVYGWLFTVTTAKTIKGVGFYDDGQNGLNITYTVGVWVVDPEYYPGSIQLYYPQSLDAAGAIYAASVPSGTTAGLSGAWRRVDLASGVAGAVLSPGTVYAIYAHNSNLSGGIRRPGSDSVVKSASSFTLPSGVIYEENVRGVDEYSLETVSADGTAYFGPVVFFAE